MASPIANGQFDDAVETNEITTTFQRLHPYIDDAGSDLSSLSSDTEISDDLDEAYDENRVEDEDWEMAERGWSTWHSRESQADYIRL